MIHQVKKKSSSICCSYMTDVYHKRYMGLTAGRLGRVISLLSSCFTLAGSCGSMGDPSSLAFPGQRRNPVQKGLKIKSGRERDAGGRRSASENPILLGADCNLFWAWMSMGTCCSETKSHFFPFSHHWHFGIGHIWVIQVSPKWGPFQEVWLSLTCTWVVPLQMKRWGHKTEFPTRNTSSKPCAWGTILWRTFPFVGYINLIPTMS